MSKRVKKKERKKNSFLIKAVTLSIALLIVLLLVLLTIQFNLVKKANDFFDREDPIVIKGECYVLFDTVFYQIKDENACRQECTNECWVREKDYSKSEFVSTPASCNLCNCYCT